MLPKIQLKQDPTVYDNQQDKDFDREWLNTHLEDSRNIRLANYQITQFNTIKSLIITRRETSIKHKICKIEYKIKAVMVILCHQSYLDNTTEEQFKQIRKKMFHWKHTIKQALHT